MGGRPRAAGGSQGELAARRTGGSWRDHGRWISSGVGGWVVGPPRSARPFSRNKYRKMAIKDFLPTRSTRSPRLCVAVEIPGRWMEAGISNGCGKVRGRVAGGPELSTAGQIPQPGWGDASPAWVASLESPRSLPDLRPGLRGRVRTCVQACVRLPRAAWGLACGPACSFARPILRPPPPSAPFGSALSRMVDFEERNETFAGCQTRRSARTGRPEQK